MAADTGLRKMPFGKYKDQLLMEVPEDYLNWLVGTLREKANNPTLLGWIEEELKSRKAARAASSIPDQASRLLTPAEVENLDAAAIFYGGALPPATAFILEQKGKHEDDHSLTAHSTLEDALAEVIRPGLPSPADDLILVWEVLPSGHRKVVWAFVGHNHGELYDQGTLPGHSRTLFDEAVEDEIPF